MYSCSSYPTCCGGVRTVPLLLMARPCIHAPVHITDFAELVGSILWHCWFQRRPSPHACVRAVYPLILIEEFSDMQNDVILTIERWLFKHSQFNYNTHSCLFANADIYFSTRIYLYINYQLHFHFADIFTSINVKMPLKPLLGYWL